MPVDGHTILFVRRYEVSVYYGLVLSLLFFCVGLIGCDNDTETSQPTEQHTEADSMARYENGTQENNSGSIKVIVVTDPAPKPTGPLPNDISCVSGQCHSSFATAKHVHGPVSVQGCMACHDEDTGKHQYPLLRKGNKICSFCHQVSGTREVQHEAVEQSSCLSCHNQHASNAKYLLKYDNVEQVCNQCHTIPLQKHAHEPFADGQCTLCHQPHQSDYKKLLRSGNDQNHCFSCHTDMRKSLDEASHKHKPINESCVQCHDPHTSSFPKELKASISDTCLSCHEQMKQRIDNATTKHVAMVADKSCANCHDPHATDNQSLLVSNEKQLCLTCHDQVITTKSNRQISDMSQELQKQFLHGPIKEDECSGCHESHGTKWPNLLKAEFPNAFYTAFNIDKYNLCFQCHNKDLVLQSKTAHLTNFRDGSVNLHYVHVNKRPKGRTCKTCHEIHASDQPKHMASTVRFEGSNWEMPLRFEMTTTGGSCTPGCHESKTYTRKPEDFVPENNANRGE